ncbi:MAG: hypothetical protein KME28_27560 [Pelatocladus maniniholoensis HA4357-MV3]|jgi:hypothetical protein|uniref:Uncharacterized protein n=1 Tax=Pelatocladus maniniholoensis HA4357-MV3 TaxID=1117104 RepID=A0A9E3HD26_9NOST|nr:hypothetical protein [Pelatocladus maniniholoensis HA4357-MV3]
MKKSALFFTLSGFIICVVVAFYIGTKFNSVANTSKTQLPTESVIKSSPTVTSETDVIVAPESTEKINQEFSQTTQPTPTDYDIYQKQWQQKQLEQLRQKQLEQAQQKQLAIQTAINACHEAKLQSQKQVNKLRETTIDGSDNVFTDFADSTARNIEQYSEAEFRACLQKAQLAQ